MKFAGIVAFSSTRETEPSVYEEYYEERGYCGDVLKKQVRNSNSDTINNNVTVNVRISIVADHYALTHFGSVAYVVYMGQKWMVESVDVQPPRLIFTLGSLYHPSLYGGPSND